MYTIPEKDLNKFTELMIEKIERIQNYPDTPWFSPRGNGLPQNLQGRVYHGINSFILNLLCDIKSYKTPAFMTFLQAKQENLKIKKDETSFPVIYWNFTYRNAEGKKISKDEYEQLSASEKKECHITPYAKIYPVFNVEQTDFPEAFPERWKELLDRFKVPEIKDEKGMFSCPQLDRMITEKAWLCPIFTELSDNAYYIPSKDEIHVPLKGQFKAGEDFYNTLLHEMGHSTGSPDRLNREKGKRFGDEKYGREELVAEMTAAVSCQALGLPARLQEDNAAYLKNWLEAITEDPMFLFTVLSDVGKAGNMILEEVNKISLAQEASKEDKLRQPSPEVSIADSLPAKEEKKENPLHLLPNQTISTRSVQLTLNF